MRPFNQALRPKFTPARLFAAGAQGAWYDPSSLWGASDHLPRRNLLTYSEDFSNAAWTKTISSATATGFLETAGGGTHFIGQTGTSSPVTAGALMVLKVRVQGVGRDWAIVGLTAGSDFATARYLRYVNLTTGALGQAISAGVSNATATATVSALGGVDIVISCSFDSSNSNAGCIFYGSTADGTSSYTGDITKGLNIYNVMRCTASTIDQSYQKVTDWTTEQYAHAASKNVPWLRRNRFLNTATLSTQTVSSVTATPLTVSFKGTGTITFSTAYVGSLVGTGASDRVSLTFTPAAGNLVCTVTGTVTEAQCEVAGAATTYQPISASWEAQYASNAAAAGVVPTLYQDSAGTTPVTGPDSVISKLNDLSGAGLHAIQSGATGLKPTLRLSPNGYWWIQRDLSDDALVTTFPNLGTSCALYLNDGSTVSETTGITLNGALTQNTPAADYGRIYLNAPSSKSAQIIKWLKAKAGLA